MRKLSRPLEASPHNDPPLVSRFSVVTPNNTPVVSTTPHGISDFKFQISNWREVSLAPNSSEARASAALQVPGFLLTYSEARKPGGGVRKRTAYSAEVDRDGGVRERAAYSAGWTDLKSQGGTDRGSRI